jgi:ribonuclease D
MVAVARTPPADPDELARVDGLGPRFVRRHGREVLRRLARPASAPPPEPRRRSLKHDPKAKERIKRLLAARDRSAAALALQSGVVCPRSVIEAVAEAGGSVSDRLTAGGLVGWRRWLLETPFSECLEVEP